MANPSTLQVLIDIKAELAQLTATINGVNQLNGAVRQTAAASQGGFANLFKIGESIDLTRRLNDVVAEIPRKIVEWTREGVLFTAEVENARRGVAAQLEQFEPERFRTFSAALGASGGVIDQLRDKARQFGLEYTAVFEQYQTTVGALISGGVRDTQKQIDLTILLGNTMRAIGIQGFQAARDTTDLLNGLAERTIAGRILQIKDDDIQRAKDAGTLYQFLTDKLKGYREAAVSASQGFSASIGRLHDNVKDLQEVTTAGIFEELKGELSDINVALARPETREAFRGYAEWAITQLKRIVAGGKEVLDTVDSIYNFLAAPGKLLGSDAAAGLAEDVLGAEQRQAAAQQFIEEAQKRRALLIEEIDHATTLNAQGRALVDLEAERIRLTERLSDKNSDIREQATVLLGLVNELISQYPSLIKGAQDYAGAWKATTDEANRAIKAASALQEVRRQTAIETAKATGDKPEQFGAKREDVYADNFRKLFSQGVDPVTAAREADALAHATEAALQHQQDLRDATKATTEAHRDLTAFIRQEDSILQGIRQQQQLINQKPFLTIDEKNAQLLTLMRQEIQTLNDEVRQGQARLDGGALDAATYEQLAQKVQQARFEIELLSQKTQTLSFGGGLKAELFSWVNQFGSAAQQVGRAITGGIGTAIDGISSALTDVIFRTGDWRQTVLQAEKAIVGSLIKIGLEMLVQATLGKFIRQQTTSDQVQSNAQVLASAAPTAAAQTGATGGSNWIIGAIAAAAAIALIIGLLAGGFEGGGYTGARGRKQIAGVVHGDEFVHDSPTTNLYGRDFHQALLEHKIPVAQARALLVNYRYTPLAPRLGSFEVGGAVAAVSASADDRDAGRESASAAPIVNNHALFYDRAEAIKWLRTKEGENFFVDLVKGTSHRLPKA